MNSFYMELVDIVGEKNVFLDEDMKKHTTFKAGGKASYYTEPSSEDEISRLIQLAINNKINYYVIGNGSNLIVRDEGYDGLIIRIGSKMSKYTIDGDVISCESGVLMSKIANESAKLGLSGLEFAAGIPGTMGGAVTMNAGAYGGEIKDVILSASVIDSQGKIEQLSKEELNLAYRTSIIQTNNYIVTSAKLKLNKVDDLGEIKDKMESYMKARKEKQPLEFPSAGSTFKRPEGHFAGKLIMDSGLRGYSIGGAQVSEKHCGFIINKGNATVSDIVALIEYVSKTVYEKTGVRLEPEVKILG